MPSESIIIVAFAVLGGMLAGVVVGLTLARRLRDRRSADSREETPDSIAPPPPSSETASIDLDAPTARDIALPVALEEDSAVDGRHADELRNVMISKMSHDLRTPLNSVITLSQLLVEGSAGAVPFEQRKYLEVIHRNGQTLLTLINDIVDLSSLEAGRLEIERGPVDLRPLLKDVSRAAIALARKKNLPLHVHLPRKAVHAAADEERLRQVVTSIVEYAVGVTTHGYVELSADSDGTRALIRVSDTSSGLSKQAHGALFDDFLTGLGPFADKEAQSEPAGPSLALVIAGRLIRLMGGEITVDSAGRDGTTFAISLPLAADDAQPRVRTEEPVLAGTASGQILLIEDDEIERRRVGAALETAGYDVTLAPSGQEGLVLLREGQFHAVVLDLVMPGMTGLDVLRAARADERLSSVPFIVLSALFMSKGERDVLGPQVAGVVRKGESTAQELTAQLRRVIAGTATETAPEAGALMKPAHVLVVDDNADNLFAIKQILGSMPVTIETAASGQDAIEACRRRRPDVVMMDVHLPGLSGLEATRVIRELPDCRNIPIIALTADAMKGDRERVLAAQCSDYLAKPVQPGDVVSAVTRALQIQFH